MERHRFDPISFVFGLLLGAVGLAFLLGRIDVGDLDITWIWPLPLIAVGLLMLLAARPRRDEENEPGPAKREPAGPSEENAAPNGGASTDA